MMASLSSCKVTPQTDSPNCGKREIKQAARTHKETLMHHRPQYLVSFHGVLVWVKRLADKCHNIEDTMKCQEIEDKSWCHDIMK